MSSIAVVLLGSLATRPSHAHELQPAVATVVVAPETVSLTVDLNLEPMILGIDLEGLENTDDASESDQYDAMRTLSADALRAEFERAWPTIARNIHVRVNDTPLPLTIESVEIPDVGNPELARQSSMQLTAEMPAGGGAVRLGWAAEYGGLIVRQLDQDGELLYAALLTSGGSSDVMQHAKPVQASLTDTVLHYIVVGIEHIVPKGLDHILFVLGLFFFALAARPLLIQVTVFTFAHTVTLALATLGYVSVPASIVEPLIALSIAYVALENLRGGEMTRARIAVVFAFGLLHGLGFAYVLGDVGLESSQFIASLVAFNIGVEIGQLSVLAVAFVCLGLPFGKQPWYRKFITVPGSLAIAVVGLYWTAERVFF